MLTCPCPDINLSQDPLAVQFVKDFKAANNGEAPGIYAAEGYDVANVTIDAIRECGARRRRRCHPACVVEKVESDRLPGRDARSSSSPTTARSKQATYPSS